ncbi:ATP synthase F1 subunit epsilon [bacterium CG2_30_37_16]|nr:MAG: ATP synthase F1 subunit epsilon [bacterium CG2_30_37_16]PIP30535.1 MAG: ATP synthase F1 subunit epsilon [bacterium (Candidatus Howlettbacteria) CG23_combo_of_CG06-09_8_20_14_all_37_9]PIX99972.1 MAG: ATP synthase F1 subunit epsilon [bacterium (Candidatus Howlettbacteria) CG_4_10_14_3_um_filter_37_10]PJB07208.1 MAG: ATP synthase F1 subunit epsilon [bacterium (Candidatus Howlettbacteria) CG_4_9_14_3_um_filter_37_10]
MKKFKIQVTTPERVIFEEEVEEVTLPTKDGEITVLAGHVPLIGEIIPGEMIVKNGEEKRITLLLGGFVHVEEGGKVIVIADSAEHLHEISEKEAIEARKRAEKLMQESIDDAEGFAEAEAELIRSLARLKIVRKHRSEYKN